MQRLPILFLFLFLSMTWGFAADAPPQASPGPPAPGPAPVSTPPPPRIIRMFPLKYADAEQLRKLFAAFSYPITTNRDFNVLVVNAPPSFQTQVEAVVKEFDVAPAPPRNIELSLYLLTGADAAGPTPLPKDLQETERQLVAASAYKAFKLADSQVIRIRAGQAGEATGGQALSQIRFRAGWISSDDKGRILSFDNLRVQSKGGAVSTDVDLREGQWAVIGRVNPDGVLVAMARVSE